MLIKFLLPFILLICFSIFLAWSLNGMEYKKTKTTWDTFPAAVGVKVWVIVQGKSLIEVIGFS